MTVMTQCLLIGKQFKVFEQTIFSRGLKDKLNAETPQAPNSYNFQDTNIFYEL